MKILLVRPPPPNFTIGLKHIMICEPLELEYVAAGANGHEIEIHDMILEKDLEGKIRSFKPEVLGTSCYITGVNIVKSICRLAKRLNTKILTIVGGVHATLVPGDFNDPCIDIIVMGEGSSIISQILKALEEKSSLDRIPNLAFPRDDGLHIPSSCSLKIDPNKLPFPKRDLVKKYREKYYYLFHQPVELIKTTFGCPFKCNFCYCWCLTQGKIYMRTPESIVEELLQIHSKEVYIVDDTFLIDNDHLINLHNSITKSKINKNYLIYGHAEFIATHPETIKEWSKIGLKACIIGLESPSDNELFCYDKKTTVEKNTIAIEIMRRNNVDVYASFIIDQSWGDKEFKLLYDYIIKTKLYYVVLQPLTPLPGTTMYEKCKNEINISRSHYELWDMQHTLLDTYIPQKQFYRNIRSIYIRTALNPLRARSLKLRTAPPIWTWKYIRLVFGCLKVMSSLRKAHIHADIISKTET